MSRITIPIGPQHPALKEPASLSVTLEGERIVDFDLRLGYNHRGIEKEAENRTFLQDIYMIERICGICSHSHATAFVQAVEELAQLEVPKRALFIRMIVAELERIHSHFLWLGVAGHEIGFDTLFMYSWRDRETVMELLATITGNRVNYGINTFGGVRRDILPAEYPTILSSLNTLEERINYYIQLALDEMTLIKRLSGVGTLTKEEVISLGIAGPTARASGVARDIRHDDPYAAYAEVSFNVITDDHCDVYGRAIVRLKEAFESCSIIRQCLELMPDGPISVKAPRKVPAGEALSRYEAPRGEDVHYVRSNGTDKPERVKVRAPTLANLQGVKTMLRNYNLADVSIVLAAIDPCFSCTDRMIAVFDTPGRFREVMDMQSLRDWSIAEYQRRGVDFAELNARA